jgi:hypothetical protein
MQDHIAGSSLLDDFRRHELIIVQLVIYVPYGGICPPEFKSLTSEGIVCLRVFMEVSVRVFVGVCVVHCVL